MSVPNVTLEQRGEQTLYGLWAPSNDRTVSKDIPHLSEQYYRAAQQENGTVFPFFALSRNYDEQTRGFELFIGSIADHEGLEAFVLPAGTYGKLTVRPKLGFLWGAAVGQAKTFFYAKWLPSSGYRAANLEYEYHTEKSVEKSPSIDLFFTIQNKSGPFQPQSTR